MPNIVKNTTILSPLDLIIPHSCRCCGRIGSVLCERCKNYIKNSSTSLCPQCKIPTQNGQCSKCHDLPPVYSVGPREGLLDILIHDFKYRSIRALGPELARLLSDTLPSDLKHAIIVPLPTATDHIRTRGLDHTLCLAKHLARQRHYRVQQILTRAHNTTQVGTDYHTRLAQANAAYAINNNIKITPQTTYILLDDVWTTGASMHTAIKKLQQAGAQNIVVALLAISRID